MVVKLRLMTINDGLRYKIECLSREVDIDYSLKPF